MSIWFRYRGSVVFWEQPHSLSRRNALSEANNIIGYDWISYPETMIQLRPPICCTFELQARRITFASFYGAADDVETRGWLEGGGKWKHWRINVRRWSYFGCISWHLETRRSSRIILKNQWPDQATSRSQSPNVGARMLVAHDLQLVKGPHTYRVNWDLLRCTSYKGSRTQRQKSWNGERCPKFEVTTVVAAAESRVKEEYPIQGWSCRRDSQKQDESMQEGRGWMSNVEAWGLRLWG